MVMVVSFAFGVSGVSKGIAITSARFSAVSFAF